MLIYRYLFPLFAQSTFRELCLNIGQEYVSHELSPQHLFEESKELTSLQTWSEDMDLPIILAPLSIPVRLQSVSNQTGSFFVIGEWLCPCLTDLSIMTIRSDIDHLAKFILSRYHWFGLTGKPVKLTSIEVSENQNYDDIGQVPIEVASKIVEIVGEDVLEWDSHKLNQDRSGWIEIPEMTG
ncbi:hypothetical protein FRC03_004043 [Tulasnella sp. 419]|nr:hypothetical protein FRC03_004043 [Tulasnella sp. 419]